MTPASSPSELRTAELIVSHLWDVREREALLFRPSVWGDEVPRQGHRQPIRRDALRAHVERLKNAVESLLIRALGGNERGTIDVEPVLAELSQAVLPGGSLVHVLPPDVHPQFEFFQDFLSGIPWESLNDEYAVCEGDSCGRRGAAYVSRSGKGSVEFCAFCGTALSLRGGTLGTARHVGHVVHAPNAGPLVSRHAAPTQPARRFALFVDPGGDLCSPERDPQGVCEAHVSRLRELLESAGYEVVECREAAANARMLLKIAADPSFAGLYFFGHGVFDQREGDGCLVLDGGERLYASEIEAHEPRVPFVFVNACEAADTVITWDLDHPPRNVGQAFASGRGRKVAVAPLWKVANAHAARSAVEFFEAALHGETLLSDAVRTLRRASHDRYANGEPDICWMAYRFFGSLEGRLGRAASTAALPAAGVPGDTVFDSEAALDESRFGFAVAEILLRAAKRRILQKRRLVTRADVLTGLVRRGALTRDALRHQDVDLDALYDALLAETERVDVEQEPESEKPTGADAWRVRRREDFHENAVELFTQAVRTARARDGADAAVAEADLLAALLDSEVWLRLETTGLPPAPRVQAWWKETRETGAVDANGQLELGDLDRAAQAIVQTAHRLADRCNVCPVSNRVVLAAFLLKSDGHLATKCKEAERKPELLCALLVASLKGGAVHPTSLLGREVAGDVLGRLLARARELAGPGNEVDEPTLYDAFCDTVHPNLKDGMRSLDPPLQIDMDAFRSRPATGRGGGSTRRTVAVPPKGRSGRREQRRAGNGASRLPETLPQREAFDEPAWAVVERAFAWARVQGYAAIRSPHLLVALAGVEDGALAAAVRERGESVEALRCHALLVVPPQAAVEEEPSGVSERTGDALLFAHERASARGERIGVLDLLIGLAAQRGIVAKVLEQSGLVAPYPWDES